MLRTPVAPPVPALAARLSRLHHIQPRLNRDQVEAHRSANSPEEQCKEDEEGEAVDEVHHVAAEEGAAGVEGVVEGSALGRSVAQLGLHGCLTGGQVGLQAGGGLNICEYSIHIQI